MNDSATVPYSTSVSRVTAGNPFRTVTGSGGLRSPMQKAADEVCRRDASGDVEYGAARSWPGATQAREEGEFYIPDLLSGDDYEPRPALYSAADAHAWRLRKAERHLADALNLSQVLRASMCDASDSRAMQVETVLKILEKKLGKAHAQIDRHEASHVNLFIAYVELREKSDGD